MTENDQPHLDKGTSRRFQISEWLLVAVLAYLFVTWLVFLLHDVRAWLPFVATILSAETEVPFFFYHVFGEGGPTELVQWFTLGAAVIVCGYLYGREAANGQTARTRFFMFVATGLCLMLIEDAGNIRHHISAFTTELSTYTRYANPVRILTEFGVYALIGSLMVFPLLRYWRSLQLRGCIRFYILAGYLAYAAASILSASRHIYEWYERVGETIIDHLPLANPDIWMTTSVHLSERGLPTLGFWLMDYLMEESLELLAASLLLAFFLSYKKSLKQPVLSAAKDLNVPTQKP